MSIFLRRVKPGILDRVQCRAKKLFVCSLDSFRITDEPVCGDGKLDDHAAFDAFHSHLKWIPRIRDANRSRRLVELASFGFDWRRRTIRRGSKRDGGNDDKAEEQEF